MPEMSEVTRTHRCQTRPPSPAVREQLRAVLDELDSFPMNRLTSHDVAEMLRMPLRTAQERVRHLCALGLIEGDGRAGYQLVPGEPVENWRYVDMPLVRVQALRIVERAANIADAALQRAHANPFEMMGVLADAREHLRALADEARALAATGMLTPDEIERRESPRRPPRGQHA